MPDKNKKLISKPKHSFAFGAGQIQNANSNFFDELVANGFYFPVPAELLINDMVNYAANNLLKKKDNDYRFKNTYTNKDFSPKYLSILDSIVINNPEYKKQIKKKNPQKFLINGSDYVPNYGGSRNQGELSITDRLFTPIGQIENTLGSFWVYPESDGSYTISDLYDFNKTIDPSKKTFWGITRALANKYSTPENDPNVPDEEKSKILIQVKK